MRSLILILSLSLILVWGPQTFSQETQSPPAPVMTIEDSEESAEDSDVTTGRVEESIEPMELHPKSTECGEFTLQGFKIRQSSGQADVSLELLEGDKIISKYQAYVDGPGNQCLKLQDLKKDGLILFEFCRGNTGTSVIVEHHTLSILRLDNKKIQKVADLDTKSIETEGTITRTLFEKTYDVKTKAGKTLLILKDKATGKISEHLF